MQVNTQLIHIYIKGLCSRSHLVVCNIFDFIFGFRLMIEIIIYFQQGDDPPFLQVGTEVSAKYKGAFCEAKVRKVVRNIKCKVCILNY